MLQFQHLDTQCPGKDITLFGRTESGKSVAAHIKGFQPSFLVKVEHRLRDTFQSHLNNVFNKVRATKRIKKIKENNEDKQFPNINNENRNGIIKCELVEAQDITDYNELDIPKFMKICANDIFEYHTLKKILTCKLSIINKQTTTRKKTVSKMMVEPLLNSVRFTKKKITETEEIDTSTLNQKSFKQNEVVHSYSPETYLMGKKYRLYNDQVGYGLQYLISKDIYSCSWMKVDGYMLYKEKKSTSCDIELVVDTHEQFECNKMAPWRILTYDIEAVPHPRGNGKFDFPKAERDPVCTIGAVLQIDDKVNKFVWILSPNGNPIDALSPIANPTDDYTSEDIQVFHFDDELKMLESFNDFIVERDIDIIEGYNSAWFDHPYLFDRYDTLMTKRDGVNTVIDRKTKLPAKYNPIWGRFPKIESNITEKVFQSNQAGKNVTKSLYCPGRIDHDAYQVMKKNHNLNSYKLDEVAKTFLGTKKYPMDYNEIHPKFQTKEGRDELAVYCVKDAWLTRKVMDNLSKLFVSFQLSCVTGISLNDVLNRGQGIRCMSLMMRYCKKRSPPFIIPRREQKKTYKKSNKFKDSGLLEVYEHKEEVFEGFKGAVVLDPKPKFYKDAIATLDFASLYPSIMQCMNMSYETIVSRSKMLRMGWTEGKEVRTVPDYYWKDGRMQTKINYDTNVIFKTKETLPGILPEILDSLLTERRLVKKIMKQHHPDDVAYKIANGRQLGLKVCANSIYGFTGANVGFLPEKRIAESVTKYGRGLTLKTQDLIENHPEWGIKHGVRCVYGDTDSVFCHLPRSLCDGKTPEETVKRAEEIGREMGEYVDSHFLRPVELEFEKVYLPFMLIKKKRYCGKKYEDGHVKIDMKGLECVRRDFCPLLVKTQKKMLEILMETMDVNAACKIVTDAMKDLAMRKVPLELLTMSKKLSRSPDEYKAMAAHVNLAKRINKERGEQHGFVAGERVPYVIARGKSFKMSENAVLPEEITSGKYVVDTDYYRDKQMIPPLTRILEKLCNNPASLFVVRCIRKPQATGIFSAWKKRKPETSQENTSSKKQKGVSLNFF